MAGPGLNTDDAFDEGSLESVYSLLNASFFGDEVVELFAHDCRGDEDFVDCGEAGGRGVCA